MRNVESFTLRNFEEKVFNSALLDLAKFKMKLIRPALLFTISAVGVSACVNEPEFSIVPSIQYEGLSFTETPEGDQTLVVSFSFKDGDGDVGLDGRTDFEKPYHAINFFANDNGTPYPLSSSYRTFTGYTLAKSGKNPSGFFYELEHPGKQLGELLTLQSRSGGFPSLPAYVDPYKCAANDESYLNRNGLPDTVYVDKDFRHLIKNKATIVDSLFQNGNSKDYWFAVVDYFYIQPNVGQYNFYVQFFVKNDDESFVEYDFAEHGCETYNGRFPILTDKARAIEGIVNYSMVGSGFLDTFGNKTLKLSITIYDRALNKSNTIETPEFRLQDI